MKRAQRNGRVFLDWFEVESFANRWPCSGLKGKYLAVSFTFNTSTGDIIKYTPASLEKAMDAEAFGALRLLAWEYWRSKYEQSSSSGTAS